MESLIFIFQTSVDFSIVAHNFGYFDQSPAKAFNRDWRSRPELNWDTRFRKKRITDNDGKNKTMLINSDTSFDTVFPTNNIVVKPKYLKNIGDILFSQHCFCPRSSNG
jgi:hypothetical protein